MHIDSHLITVWKPSLLCGAVYTGATPLWLSDFPFPQRYANANLHLQQFSKVELHVKNEHRLTSPLWVTALIVAIPLEFIDLETLFWTVCFNMHFKIGKCSIGLSSSWEEEKDLIFFFKAGSTSTSFFFSISIFKCFPLCCFKLPN